MSHSTGDLAERCGVWPCPVLPGPAAERAITRILQANAEQWRHKASAKASKIKAPKGSKLNGNS